MDSGADVTSGPLDWNVPSKISSASSNINFQNEPDCNLKIDHFDQFYNSDGCKIALPAGQAYRDNQKRNRTCESALVATKVWNRNQEFDSKYLEIKSPHMKAAIKAVVPKFRTINVNVPAIRLDGPPHLLYHYREELQAHGMALEATNPEAARHIHFLLSYMWNEFLDETIAFFSFMFMSEDAVPTLEFEYLWMVFRPKDLVLIRRHDQDTKDYEMVFQFVGMTRGSGRWEVEGYCIDYDGVRFGYTKQTESIKHYYGYRTIKDLELVPMQFVENSETVRARLIARGKRFTELHGQHHLMHDSVGSFLPNPHNEAYDDDDDDQPTPTYRSQMAKGRIMIDLVAFQEANSFSMMHFVLSENLFIAKEGVARKMTDDELIICLDYVYGYSLRNNAWGRFHIDNTKNIDLDTSAFDELILQRAYKEQILSLVKVHGDTRLQFDDFIKGKGRGVVFLLHGEPGTGKTLTAEGIADYCDRPLLRLDAATLGTTPESVEEQLSSSFKIAERWHAVVLIDEADVFLEQRESQGLIRNALVSVFLRMLEYYQGILILTTNRVGCFDKAFKSRIHLAIRYPPLSNSSRRALWKSFLRKVSEETANELDTKGVLEKLATEPLNGRQIKNLVRTASALAINDEGSGGRVLQRHLELALEPMKRFIQDMELESAETSGSAGSKPDDHTSKRRRIG
ncbi:hypothetical protein PGQ11_005738 [Apiospora arundinis]|uniref:AAA+ ATPase domain-containing protein n=1 Tax=Apiospora arundinis TaxID=335852 RepID=A0ABR2JBP0_9PEZI